MKLTLKYVGESKGLFKYEIQPNVITPEKPATGNKPITPAVTDLDDILAKVKEEDLRITRLPSADGTLRTIFMPTHHYLCEVEDTVIEAVIEAFDGKDKDGNPVRINYFPELKTPLHKAKQDAFAKKKKQLEEKVDIMGLVDIWEIVGETQRELIDGAFDIQDRRDRRELHKAKLLGVNQMNKMRLKMLTED
jgi:hypothetical protein